MLPDQMQYSRCSTAQAPGVHAILTAGVACVRWIQSVAIITSALKHAEHRSSAALVNCV